MDKTREYIKKLEKAPEIQKEWVPQNGDFVWHPNEGVKHMGTWEFPEKFDIVSLSEDTDTDFWHHWLWLPLQYQLQELVTKVKPIDWYFMGQTTRNNTLENWEDFQTDEQLWLAFVMKEKFKKVWDGKDWVKEKKDG